MVHISLEAIETSAVPKDLFISLRVGDVQKFAKAAASKTYKFPAAAVGDRRYGKIEVYRRIGICSVMIDPSTLQGAHEISVPLDDERLPNLKYRFNLDDGEAPVLPNSADKPTQESPVIDDKPLKDLHGRVKAAKEYLDKHQLEMRLSEAMQAVLRERPEDPGAFVASKLVNRAGMVTKVDADANAESNTQQEEATAAAWETPWGAPTAPWDLKPSVGSWASAVGRLAKPELVSENWQSAKSKTRSMQGFKRAGNFAAWTDPDYQPHKPESAELAWNCKPSVGSWTSSAPTPLCAPLKKKKKDETRVGEAPLPAAAAPALAETPPAEQEAARVGEAPAPAVAEAAPAEKAAPSPAAEAAGGARQRPAIVATGRTALGRSAPFLII